MSPENTLACREKNKKLLEEVTTNILLILPSPMGISHCDSAKIPKMLLLGGDCTADRFQKMIKKIIQK